ncbi:MAG: hypothetical protein COW00_20115 [Bdellovibrio sp. CG12_big_fil_rev_8_21_14_0_65_39_13]|nr:MAG: hypothetical protein COW78_01790 [Bdellovibrio sp. CG22_combo_CG10-13_8_21_14_all_39_27]PIQ57535.1 MAG: hypothetical protein COW00_20115 [Bdellovibrio sp. CG12_big_fil_rev_8_21_14_0_65_39_13]PIR33738.1 MAG: hypothetical protein COV37_15205 [Bdellovibrio sp. CG11_big_fil_rev_8_21_14_0_20_39_38]
MKYLSVLFLLFSRTLFANESALDEMAKRLMSLRLEVETLSKQADAEKQDFEIKLRNQSGLRQEVEAQIKREELKFAAQDEKKNELLKQLSQNGNGHDETLSFMKKQAEFLNLYIESSPPFRKNERKEEVVKLIKKFEDKKMIPEKAMQQLWMIFEDELRLSKEVVLTRSNLNIEGQELMVDLLRLGTIGLYFKTADNKYGYWNGEQSHFFQNEEESKQISFLMDGIKKQIKNMTYKIPKINLESKKI